MFPRYLFIQLGTTLDAKSWAPIRSTTGVSRLVTFGQTPARVDSALIDELRRRNDTDEVQQRHFQSGEALVVTQGSFVGVEAIYQMTDAEGRVMVLLDILSKQVKMRIEPAAVRKHS